MFLSSPLHLSFPLRLILFFSFLLPYARGDLFTLNSPDNNDRIGNLDGLVLEFDVTVPVGLADATLNYSLTCGSNSYSNVTFFIWSESGTLKGKETTLSPEAIFNCTGKTLNLNLTYSAGTESETYTLQLNVISQETSKVYVVCAMLSFLSCLILLYLYWQKYPVLRVGAFASKLVACRIFMDMVFAVTFIILHGTQLLRDTSTDACSPALTFFYQFALISSLGYYAIMTINFYLSISDPWTKPQRREKLYHFLVALLAIATSIISAIHSDYRQDFQLCWHKKTPGINVLNWTLCWMWIILFFVSSVITFFFGYRRFYRISRKVAITFPQKVAIQQITGRVNAFKRNGAYIVFFSLFYGLIEIIWVFASNSADGDSVVAKKGLLLCFVFIISLMGLIDSLIWLLIQRLWPEDHRDIDQDHDLSHALRHFMITKMLDAIRLSLDLVVLKDKKTRQARSGRRGDPPLLSDQDRKASVEDQFVQWDDQKKMYVISSERQNEVKVEVGEGEELCKALFPDRFQLLRHRFKVDKKAYATSLKLPPFENYKGNFTEGGSGTYMFCTWDEKYLVKTITNEEKEVFRRTLDHYLSYMWANWETSFLPKFFGLYECQLLGQTQYFLVMNNLAYSGSRRIYWNYRFDLKGSKFNRETRKGTGKDLNWETHPKLLFEEEDKERILNALEKDITFLCSHELMDYSLLVLIGYCRQERRVEVGPFHKEQGFQETYLPPSVWGPGYYQFGLIDIFQQWTASKTCELYLKRIFCWKWSSYRDISALPPLEYKQRFSAMLESKLFSDGSEFKSPPDITLPISRSERIEAGPEEDRKDHKSGELSSDHKTRDDSDEEDVDRQGGGSISSDVRFHHRIFDQVSMVPSNTESLRTVKEDQEMQDLSNSEPINE